MRRIHRHWASVLSLLMVPLTFIAHSSIADDREEDSPQRPNIVIFVADDASVRDFGTYGNPSVRTPNIDALAKSGVQMTQAVLTTAQCSPSRISVLSGRYPHSTGAEDLHMPMPEEVEILPGLLGKQGYYTGHMLKRHYGPAAEKQFDWYDDGLEKFTDFLNSAEDAPFFLWVGFEDPHRPYKEGTLERPHEPKNVFVPPYLVDAPGTRKDLAMYYDEVSRMDVVIGDFVNELERRNLRENTLVIFFSDNGAPFPREKGTLYDAGILTPLLFSWPRKIGENSVYSKMVSMVDLAPTLLDLAKVDIPTSMQGGSFSDALFDNRQEGRRYAFSERNWHDCDEHLRSVRTENFKLIKNAYLNKPLCTAADISHSLSYKDLYRRKEANKLTDSQNNIFVYPRKRYELYDLKSDPFELKDLSEDPNYEETLKDLSRVLENWIEDTEDFPPTQRLREDLTDRYTGKWLTTNIPTVK